MWRKIFWIVTPLLLVAAGYSCGVKKAPSPILEGLAPRVAARTPSPTPR